MARHRDRQCGLKVLFEIDLVPQATQAVLERSFAGQPDLDRDFVTRLVEGTLDHQGHIDEVLTQSAVDWRIDRMPTIDRTILRLATYELLYEPGLPVSIVIDEAVELAKAYSTEEARKFINGVLAAVSRTVRREDAEAPVSSESVAPGEHLSS